MEHIEQEGLFQELIFLLKNHKNTNNFLFQIMIWSALPVIIISVVWLYWRYKNRRLLAMAETIPGPPALPFLGNALKFMCQPEGKLLEISSTYML